MNVSIMNKLLFFSEPTENKSISISKTKSASKVNKNGLFANVFSMGGDHGHSKLSMPDWRQWKVEGTPLEFTQQRLKARGLKDPWARSVFVPTWAISDISLYSLWRCCLSFSPVTFTFSAAMRRGGIQAASLVLLLCQMFCWEDSSGALLPLL